MITFLTIFHVLVCLFLIVVVLLQFGKGAESGGLLSSASGSTQSIFSSSTKGNFLTKATTFLAICFMTTSILLTVQSSKNANKSVLDNNIEAININLNNDKKVETTTAPAAAVSTNTPNETTPPASNVEKKPTTEEKKN